MMNLLLKCKNVGETKTRWPIEDMSYGTREFGIEDCNGYILAFARRT